VTVYHVKGQGDKPPLIIIDTPGFGDTRGIEYDSKIISLIKKLFENDIEVIHAVLFVV